MEHTPARITEPLIVPAALDPDAVKILRRLRRFGHEAYLVGGCVRDLSLGRIPKDFDIATSARPRQIKRLFRNSRIIGRRFKLVHIQFGDKLIEVSTFRQKPRPGDSMDGEPEFGVPEVPEGGGDDFVPPPDELFAGEGADVGEDRGGGADERVEPAAADPDFGSPPEPAAGAPPRAAAGRSRGADDAAPEDGAEDGTDSGEGGDGGDEEGWQADDLMIRRDNVFGTAEEDAVRRDFTINALFYDIDENVVLDYVGGAPDLERRVIRTIGEPDIRFQEDPVRILRAIKFAARLDFSIEPKTYDAMVRFRGDLKKCAAPRLAEELLRLLSCGNARGAWLLLESIGVLEVILPDIAAATDPAAGAAGSETREQLLAYLGVVDEFDRGRRAISNAVLYSLLLAGLVRDAIAKADGPRDPAVAADRVVAPFASRLAVSRRDAFRIKQIVVAQPRLKRQKQGRRRRRVKPIDMVRRDYFKDALDFFCIEAHVLNQNFDDAERWLSIWFDHLRHVDPRGHRQARIEALFLPPEPGAEGHGDRDAGAPDERDADDAAPIDADGNQQADAGDAAGLDPDGDAGDAADEAADEADAEADELLAPQNSGGHQGPPGEGEPRRGRRRRRRRRGRRGDGPGAGAQQQPQHPGQPQRPSDVEAGAGREREGLPEDAGVSEGGAAGRDADSAELGADRAASENVPAPAPAQGRHEGRRGDRRDRRGDRRDRGQDRGQDRGHDRGHDRNRGGGPRTPADSDARRLEFDEVRSGPLRNPEGAEPPPEPEVEEDDQIEIAWDAPLPKVGDPGPISVIRTGIDQTEKRGRRRKNKRKDPAQRELSKEVQDQPSLQAFKMTEGDPRGHEATRPRKPRRKPDDVPPPEKDRPFDFERDFESIEDIFSW